MKWLRQRRIPGGTWIAACGLAGILTIWLFLRGPHSVGIQSEARSPRSEDGMAWPARIQSARSARESVAGRNSRTKSASGNERETGARIAKVSSRITALLEADEAARARFVRSVSNGPVMSYVFVIAANAELESLIEKAVAEQSSLASVSRIAVKAALADRLDSFRIAEGNEMVLVVTVPDDPAIPISYVAGVRRVGELDEPLLSPSFNGLGPMQLGTIPLDSNHWRFEKILQQSSEQD